EERAEEQGVDAVEEAMVEADEQEAQAEGEGLDRADRRRLLTEAGALAARPGSRDGGDDRSPRAAERKEPPGGAHPDQGGARSPGEARNRQRVTGEALRPQHHEPAEEPGRHGHDRARPEGVDHEVERKELADVLDEVPG